MINDALLPSGSTAISAYRHMPLRGAARFMRPGTQRAILLVACELRFRYPANPVADVEKPRTAAKTEIQVFSPEEVMALVRAAD